MSTRFRDDYRNLPDIAEPRAWKAVEVEDFRICRDAELTLRLAASALMALPRCQTPGLPDVRDIVTDMRELIERLERARELIDRAIESEDEL
jgi:hypothetical protein